MKKILRLLLILTTSVVIASGGVLTGCSNQSVSSGTPAGDTIFSNAPKNPKTPAEVTAAWYFLINREDYLSAMKLYFGADEAYKHATAGGLSKEQMSEIYEKLSSWMDQIWGGSGSALKGKVLKQLSISKVEAVSHRAQVSGTLYFTDGTTFDITGTTLLIYDNNWYVR